MGKICLFTSFLFTVYQDLLAVIASTERRFFRMKFDDEVNIFQLHDLLLSRLSFDSISTTVYVEDVNTSSSFFVMCISREKY